MMGVSHAATGLLAGAAVGVFGSHVSDPFICAAIGAGAACCLIWIARVDGGAFFGGGD